MKGLFLEGAGWDKKASHLVKPKRPLHYFASQEFRGHTGRIRIRTVTLRVSA